MTSRRPRPSVRPLLAFFFLLLGASSALLQLGGIATKAPATATKRAPATAARRGWRATPPPGPSARAARRRRLVARFALPISSWRPDGGEAAPPPPGDAVIPCPPNKLILPGETRELHLYDSSSLAAFRHCRAHRASHLARVAFDPSSRASFRLGAGCLVRVVSWESSSKVNTKFGDESASVRARVLGVRPVRVASATFVTADGGGDGAASPFALPLLLQREPFMRAHLRDAFSRADDDAALPEARAAAAEAAAAIEAKAARLPRPRTLATVAEAVAAVTEAIAEAPPGERGGSGDDDGDGAGARCGGVSELERARLVAYVAAARHLSPEACAKVLEIQTSTDALLAHVLVALDECDGGA